MPKENQTELPEMKGEGVAAAPAIPELDALAATYVAARDARMEKTPPEVEAKNNLINAIHANADKLPRNQKSGAITYKNEALIVELTPAKEKLRVRAADQPKAPEDSETEE